jgi:hypothetical protein
MTLFRVTAGMGWVDAVLPVKLPDGNINWKVAIYMISYVVVANWTLLQVRTLRRTISNTPRNIHSTNLSAALSKVHTAHPAVHTMLTKKPRPSSHEIDHKMHAFMKCSIFGSQAYLVHDPHHRFPHACMCRDSA